MKIVNLIKCEFLKNYNIKKLIIFILVLLISSIAIVEYTNIVYQPQKMEYYSDVMIRYDYDELLNKENRTIEEEYNLYKLKIDLKIHKYVKGNEFSANDWRDYLAGEISQLLSENYAIELLINNRDNQDIITACKTNTDYYVDHFNTRINHLCNEYSSNELKALKDKNQNLVDDYTYLIKTNKYYEYLSYEIEHQKESGYYIKSREMADFIIDKKITDMDIYLVKNYIQYSDVSRENCISKQEFLDTKYNETNEWNNYNHYLKYCQIKNKEGKADNDIIAYSTFNQIPHDLPVEERFSGASRYNYYLTSKVAVNQVFHLSIVVLVLVSITSGGIISKEHSEGTIKNLITTPVKRWKILFSKFIYLILHTYILWLIGLVVISLYAGFRYGFNDLLTPKLIYSNGQVVEVNYYFNLLKEMFLASIPMIAFLSVLFFLSTITLNTAFTTSITSILGISSPILYFICSNWGMKFLVYTPFIYLDHGFIYNRSEWYEMILRYFNADMNLNTGIIISLITIVILYIITNLIYIKRDIKN